MRKIPPYQGGVSKFNILAHRLGFRTYGEGAVRMVQHHPQATTQMSHSDTPSFNLFVTVQKLYPPIEFTYPSQTGLQAARSHHKDYRRDSRPSHNGQPQGL